jgi:hypothetical protein
MDFYFYYTWYFMLFFAVFVLRCGRIYQRHLTSVSEIFTTGFSYKEISEIRIGNIPDILPTTGVDPPTNEPSESDHSVTVPEQ